MSGREGRTERTNQLLLQKVPYNRKEFVNKFGAFCSQAAEFATQL